MLNPVKLMNDQTMEKSMGKLLILVALLSAGAAPPASLDDQKPGNGKEKLICQREVPIGSLIATRKVCLTASEWEQRRVDGRDTAYKLMMDGMGKDFSGGGGGCAGPVC
jgi:hypothetical protein